MTDLNHKTISQGRKTIVFGMPWYAVSEEESPRKAAAGFSKESLTPFDLLVERKGVAPQFAIASSLEGAKSGAISAASIVAEMVSVESWIYVLEIDASVWICSGRDGYILPDGDRVYSNRETARRAFNELTPSSFKKIYLPPSWKAFSGEKSALQDIASDIEETNYLEFIEYAGPKWGRLASLSPVSGAMKALLGIAILGAVCGAGYFFFLSGAGDDVGTGPDPKVLARLLDEKKRAAEKEAARQAYLDDLRGDRPWQDAPPAAEVFLACLEAIKSMPTQPVGYDITSLHCENGTLDAVVKRTTGYTPWLQEWAEGHEGLRVSLSTNGDDGYLSRDLDRLTQRGYEDLSPFDSTSRELLVAGQIDGARLKIDTPKADLIKDEPDYVPAYATSTYSISTLRPSAWEAIFRNTPGLTIDAVSYSKANKLYEMEGKIYVPNH